MPLPPAQPSSSVGTWSITVPTGAPLLLGCTEPGTEVTLSCHHPQLCVHQICIMALGLCWLFFLFPSPCDVRPRIPWLCDHALTGTHWHSPGRTEGRSVRAISPDACLEVAQPRPQGAVRSSSSSKPGSMALPLQRPHLATLCTVRCPALGLAQRRGSSRLGSARFDTAWLTTI